MMVVGASVAALSGCTGSRPTTLAVSPQPAAGGSWSAVLPGQGVGRQAGISDTQQPFAAAPGWILSRNDSALSARAVEPLLATTDWPERERPSVQRPILIRVYEQPGRFYSYRPQHRRYSGNGARYRY